MTDSTDIHWSAKVCKNMEAIFLAKKAFPGLCHFLPNSKTCQSNFKISRTFHRIFQDWGNPVLDFLTENNSLLQVIYASETTWPSKNTNFNSHENKHYTVKWRKQCHLRLAHSVSLKLEGFLHLPHFSLHHLLQLAVPHPVTVEHQVPRQLSVVGSVKPTQGGCKTTCK